MAIGAKLLTHSHSQSPSVFHMLNADAEFKNNIVPQKFVNWLHQAPEDPDEEYDTCCFDEILVEILPHTLKDLSLPHEQQHPNKIRYDPQDQQPMQHSRMEILHPLNHICPPFFNSMANF
mmetsp:Transcript_70997/g.117586  ORF Transcript_70997/g.117586 Transcript_70997/m.117586 type:complete len:120 (-) Transcript_70997:155-514(-)